MVRRLAIWLALGALAIQSLAGADLLVYIGTFTSPAAARQTASEGIYASSFNPQTGELSAPKLAAETDNPTFLAISHDRHFLYSVNESDGALSGVSAFSIDRTSGELTLLNHESAKGPGPCHLAIDKSGRNILVANYAGGSIALFPLAPNGKIEPASIFIQHSGSSVNPDRQKSAHAHWAGFTPDNRIALVADLGLDQILRYRFDAIQHSLAPADPPFVKIKPGSGPRHLAFHPSGRFVYLLSEMASTVTVFSFDPKSDALDEIQTVKTLPREYTGPNSAAEIAIDRSGRFLYASNRGHDSIAVFAIGPARGDLTPVEFASTKGKTPRHFEIDPTGAWLLAANQDTGNIVEFRISHSSGKLQASGITASVPSPVCIKFLER